MTHALHPAGGAGRLFLGVTLTEQVRAALQGHLQSERLPGRAVAACGWHLTLRFLGDTSHETVNRLHEALGVADLGQPFDVVFGTLGAFPDPACASVLWIGVDEGTDALSAVAARLEGIVRQVGFAAEERPFAPHLTLSRLRPPVDVRELAERVPALQARMAVNAVVLFRTRHGQGLGRYEQIQRYPLRLEVPGAVRG